MNQFGGFVGVSAAIWDKIVPQANPRSQLVMTGSCLKSAVPRTGGFPSWNWPFWRMLRLHLVYATVADCLCASFQSIKQSQRTGIMLHSCSQHQTSWIVKSWSAPMTKRGCPWSITHHSRRTHRTPQTTSIFRSGLCVFWSQSCNPKLLQGFITPRLDDWMQKMTWPMLANGCLLQFPPHAQCIAHRWIAI